ncbi:acyltransferase family protein [Nocardioides sp. C4-1]|uniref:acyltransferase family protein n=1 Tax=Nocardioides sp. C4-1 TaxID=3151851 RepID=UPI003267DC48
MTQETGEAPPTFRRDVQGMRAVAVLAVIAAHSSIAGFGGGFVGVDVFFVISGYLITRLILGSIETDGRFRVGAFYARRARRIVPAATVVLAVTMVASVVYLNFLEVIDATRDAVWAAFFVANLRFATEGVDYFALEDAPSPFQHYWSLAVEEQFYIVWPVLVALALVLTRGFRRRRDDDGQRVRRTAPVRTMAFFALVLGGASLAWSVHRTVTEPTSAYFSTFTRAWELAAGVLVALVLHKRAGLRFRWLTEPLALAGITGIVIAITAYDTTMAFPGYEALLPVLSTAALILAGSHPEHVPFVSRALALKPFRVIGDWSYSLYLWHWPVIVIPQVHMQRPLGVTETVIAVALIFQFGYLTHRFVEQPFRTGQFWRRRTWRGLLLYPASLVLVLPTVAVSYQVGEYLGGERGNNPAIEVADFSDIDDDAIIELVEKSVDAGQTSTPIPSDLTPDLLDLADDIADVGECNYQLQPRPLCKRGAPDADKTLVVTGDSHARAWIPAFEKIAAEAGYATYYLVKQQCTASFVDPGRLGTGDPWPECAEFHDWVVEQVTDIQPDLMIVATSPPPAGIYVDGELVNSREGVHQGLAEGFDDMFATYEPLVGKLMLLEDVPRLPEEPGACLAANDLMRECIFEPTAYNEEMRLVSVEAAERASIEHIDPTPWLCSEGLCPVVIGSTIAYRDRSHITAVRAGELWFPLGVELGLLEDPNGRAQDKPRPSRRNRSSSPPVSPSLETSAPSSPETDPTTVGPGLEAPTGGG